MKSETRLPSSMWFGVIRNLSGKSDCSHGMNENGFLHF